MEKSKFMDKPKRGRPPIEIEPLLNEIRENPYALSDFFRSKFPREWKAARRAKLIQTFTPAITCGRSIVRIIDPDKADGLPPTMTEIYRTLRKSILALPPTFTPNQLLDLIGQGNVDAMGQGRFPQGLNQLVRNGELTKSKAADLKSVLLHRTPLLSLKTQGRKPSPHPLRPLLEALRQSPRNVVELRKAFGTPKINAALQANLMEKFYDPATQRNAYRLTPTAPTHTDYPTTP